MWKGYFFIIDFQILEKYCKIFGLKNLEVRKSSRNFALAFGNEGA